MTAVANELDSFDGRSEPERCSRLVSRLRQEQVSILNGIDFLFSFTNELLYFKDRVLAIINQIMDELLTDDRSCRAFRAKFPEEVLQESLAGQLWFGAECLSAGSAILNREVESAEMRPLAKAVTKSLDNVRNMLRDQCLRHNTPNSPTLKLDFNDSTTENLYESLKIFDRLFAEFELLYVSAMVQVKTIQEHEIQELICVLFSETLQRALKLGILEQEQVDSYDPSLMFSIPRLAIISGLIIFNKGPLNMDQNSDQLSEMFRPFRKLLIKMRDYLRTLNKNELLQLEKLLCTNEEIGVNQSSADEQTTTQTVDNQQQPKDNTTTSTTATTNVKIVTYNSPNTNDDNHPYTTTMNQNREKDEENDYCDRMPSTTSDWIVEDEDVADDEDEQSENTVSYDNLMAADCASGYLVPNTNLGNLLQSTNAPLTYNIIPSGQDDKEQEPANVGGSELPPNVDSGLGNSENVSLDRSPEDDKELDNSKMLSEQYDENWENLRKIVEPSSSSSRINVVHVAAAVGPMASTSYHPRTKIKKSSRKSKKMVTGKSANSSTSSSSSSSSSVSSSVNSTPTFSSNSNITDHTKDVGIAMQTAGRMKFK